MTPEVLYLGSRDIRVRKKRRKQIQEKLSSHALRQLLVDLRTLMSCWRSHHLNVTIHKNSGGREFIPRELGAPGRARPVTSATVISLGDK